MATVTLTPQQQAWLEAQAASGGIPSVEDAVRAAVADVMAIADDDLAWARADVEAARSAMADGQSMDGGAFLASLRARISVLKSA